jgi:hypothetical protein
MFVSAWSAHRAAESGEIDVTSQTQLFAVKVSGIGDRGMDRKGEGGVSGEIWTSSGC